MIKNWFTKCTSPNEVKILWRGLAQEHHPDVSGYDSTRAMQDINSAYLKALEKLDRYTSTVNGKEWTYYYNEGRETEAMGVVGSLVKAKFSQAVTIELLGTWVWVSGIERGSDDMAIHKALKHPTKLTKKGTPASLLRWHGKRQLFYWSPPDSRSKFNARASFNDLRYTYGSRSFKSEEESKAKSQPVMAFGD